MGRLEQRLGSVTLADGATVAYGAAGSGPPLLFVAGWLSHLELSWALPAERYLLESLAQGRTLLRYDRLGCGLSDRPEVWTPSLESELEVIDAVLTAHGVERCDLVGSSLGAPIGVAWAARHPERVRRLVLYGGWVRGAEIASADVQEHLIGLIEGHWGLGADVLADIFAPEVSRGTRAALASYQRQASSAATAAELLALCYRIDVTESLAKVRSPTLVVSRADDRAAPPEQAEKMAAGIGGAQLRLLPGRSHLPFVGEVDPLVAAIRTFLGPPALRRSITPQLTRRQREVAELVAQGLTNRQIGDRLHIEERSAEGHVERIRVRLGIR